MLIHELSDTTGVTKQAIRFYEKRGLLKSQPRQAGSRYYAEYDERSIQALKHIKLLQTLGFSLNEIGEFIHDSIKHEYGPRQRKATLESKLAELQAKRADIDYVIRNVRDALAKYH